MSRMVSERNSTLVNKKVFLIFGSLYSVTIGSLLFAMNEKIQADTISRPSVDKIALLNLFISVLFLAFSVSTTKIQNNMAFFWSFHIIFFGFNSVLLQLDTTPIYLARVFTEAMSSDTIFTVLLTTVVAGTAQICVYRKYKNLLQPKAYVSVEDTVQKRIFFSSILYFLVLPFLINALGGFNSIFRRIRISNEPEYNSLAIKSIFESLLYVPPVILLLGLLFIPKQQRFKRNQVLIRIFIPILIVLSNPFGNARQITLFLILPFVFYLLSKGRKIYSYAFFLVLPIMLSFSANLVNRYSGRLQNPTLTILSRDGDFDSLAQLHNGLQATSDYEFPVFRQLLGSLLFFVPRSVWSDKPLDTGIELANYLGLRFQNLSAPWILEAYVNARIPGVLLTAFFIGYLITKMDLNQSSGIRQFVMAFTISGLLFILLRGSLLQASGRAIFAFVLIQILFTARAKRR